MPHSLKSKIKGLRYKGIITDKDCDRLCQALDAENALNEIKNEIEHYNIQLSNYRNMISIDTVLQIIDRYQTMKRVNK